MKESPKDMLGQELDDTERELLDLYHRLRTLCGRHDLAPCVSSNVRFATAAMWQVMNDLDIEWEHAYDVGV